MMRVAKSTNRTIVGTIAALQAALIVVFAHAFVSETRLNWKTAVDTASVVEHDNTYKYVQEAVDSLERRYEALMKTDVFWSQWDATAMHERHVKNGLAFIAKAELTVLDAVELKQVIDDIFTSATRFKALQNVLDAYAVQRLCSKSVKKYFENEEAWLDNYKTVLLASQKDRVQLHASFVEEAVKITLYVASICD